MTEGNTIPPKDPRGITDSGVFTWDGKRLSREEESAAIKASKNASLGSIGPGFAKEQEDSYKRIMALCEDTEVGKRKPSGNTSKFNLTAYKEDEVREAIKRFERIQKQLVSEKPKDPKVLEILNRITIDKGQEYDFLDPYSELPSDDDSVVEFQRYLYHLDKNMGTEGIDVDREDIRNAAKYLLGTKGLRIINNFIIAARSERPKLPLERALEACIFGGIKGKDSAATTLIVSLMKSISSNARHKEETKKFQRPNFDSSNTSSSSGKGPGKTL